MIFLMWIFAVQATSNLSFQVFEFAKPNVFSSWSVNIFSPQNWDVWKNEKVDEIQYILVTGKWWGNHDAPDLTDTLILVWINNKQETISMLSIPRDLYIEYPKSDETGKINEVYYRGLQRWEKQAMNELMAKITEITGKEVQSYINLNFQGFIEIVDALDWVEVTLDENLVDYNYPDGNLGYKTFILRKWTWNLDGEVALMYARSRYSTSDFDRSLRQQEIISWMKEKVLDLGYFKDRKKFKELYDILNKYIDTNLSFSEMLDLALELKSWELPKTLSYNLNDSCFYEVEDCGIWGFLYTPLRQYFDGKSVILPNWATYFDLGVYDEVKDFAKLIFDDSRSLTHPKNIVIYNASETPGLATSAYNTLKPYGIVKDDFIQLKNITEKKFEKSILHYNNVDKNDEILKILEKVLDIESQESEVPLYSGTGTQIEIILIDPLEESSSN